MAVISLFIYFQPKNLVNMLSIRGNIGKFEREIRKMWQREAVCYKVVTFSS